MMPSTKNKLIPIVLLSFASFAMAGCGSVFDFNKLGTQFTPTQQVTETKVVKTTKTTVKKPVSRTISNDCSYVIRDLSVPNAKAVWCIPRASQ